jgi:hypothetical protein
VVLVLPLVTLAGCGGCGNSDGSTTLAASASVLASSGPPPSANTLRYVVDPKARTSIDMPAPKEHIKAATTAAAGALQVDVMNLANTRGEIKIDLSTLETHTFDIADKDSAQTDHARNWLEIGNQANNDTKEKNRFIVYAIRSIDGLSVPNVTMAPVSEQAGDDVRTVSLTSHGELLLHGHKVDKEAQLEVRLHYPRGASADAKPLTIVVKTKQPLHIVLAEHDVKPRDNFGKLAEGAFGLLGTKVANVADVQFELRMTPE